MVKHVVMFKLKEYNAFNERQVKLITIKQGLESLVEKITEIKSLEVGINVNTTERAYDIILISEFENFSDLNKYKENSEHKKVVEIIKEATVSSVVTDYLV